MYILLNINVYIIVANLQTMFLLKHIFFHTAFLEIRKIVVQSFLVQSLKTESKKYFYYNCACFAIHATKMFENIW